MAELNPPWALEQLATHHSNVNRMFMSALSGRGEGVIYGMAITQRGAGANMSVDIAKGSAIVFGTENEQQGTYGVTNDATTNVIIGAADPTNPRRDLIVARVRDAFYSGATNAWALEAVAGTPAGSPADPTVPANSLVLARVAVAAAAASITNANITDLRPFTPVGIFPVNSARRPGTLYGPFDTGAAFAPTAAPGLFVLDTDTFALNGYTTSTTGFVPPWNLPWGHQGTPAIRTSTQTGIGAAATDLTGLSVTITVPANRRLKLTACVMVQQITGSGTPQLLITDSANVVKQTVNWQGAAAAAEVGGLSCTTVINGTTAGTFTYKLRLTTSGNTVNTIHTATIPGILTVEDIGPSTTPA